MITDRFYDTALSSIHDNYFGQLAMDASVEIKHLLKDTDPSTQQVIDLGCGSGILAKELCGQGFMVLGVDISAPMLEIAKHKAPAATFIQSSLFDFSIPLCNVVCAVGEPVNYLFENNDTNNSVRTLCSRVFNQLMPDGYFIFDILTTEAEKTPAIKIIENEQVTMIVQTSVEMPAAVLTRKMIFFTKEGDHFIKHKETPRQQLFDRVEITNMLRETGFNVTVKNNYNGHTFRQGHFAFICKK